MDFTLLRPFDLEAAKRGDPVCSASGLAVRWVGVGGNGQRSIIELGDDDLRFLEYARADALRMAPLCWVDGRPVYKGDGPLFPVSSTSALGQGPFTAVSDAGNGGIRVRTANGAVPICCVENLTWAPPRVKREGWVNIYPKPTEELVASVSHAHAGKEKADSLAASGRIACIRIEWEEPAE